MLDQSLNVIPRVSETTYEAPTPWRRMGAKTKARNIAALCKRNNVQPNRIIEVGAGDGAILQWLDGIGFSPAMYALEISQSGVDVIKAQNIPRVRSVQTFNGYTAPFETGYFDVAILSHVLEHVEYERILLREVQRISRFQVIEVPLDYRDNADSSWVMSTSYGHINLYTPTSLRFLLKTEKFKIIDDFPGVMDADTAVHSYFSNGSQERTPFAESEVRSKHEQWLQRFSQLPRAAQEKNSTFYAVLTRGLDELELFEERLLEAQTNMISKNAGIAKMILSYISEIGVPEGAHFPAWAQELMPNLGK